MLTMNRTAFLSYNLSLNWQSRNNLVTKSCVLKLNLKYSIHTSVHFYFGEKCGHFNALYFHNERAEQLCKKLTKVMEGSKN